ncbi:hypothetical protein SAMN05444266_103126 [Chitinophaga jiangningensis]|uniref:HTH araC/xylS-type domain-containing protein n=1 Tax=Chitinophaga jiangningensis TaxID=1419482 RepID=A0A1M7A4R0_9BACT|nr:hypothetical protein [Chitinophaga jiangningensis]SHL37707.1 hypothetical protein SAMN05444266_103126 [Chitinophaga jiangningensis]
MHPKHKESFSYMVEYLIEQAAAEGRTLSINEIANTMGISIDRFNELLHEKFVDLAFINQLRQKYFRYFGNRKFTEFSESIEIEDE